MTTEQAAEIIKILSSMHAAISFGFIGLSICLFGLHLCLTEKARRNKDDH